MICRYLPTNLYYIGSHVRASVAQQTCMEYELLDREVRGSYLVSDREKVKGRNFEILCTSFQQGLFLAAFRSTLTCPLNAKRFPPNGSNPEDKAPCHPTSLSPLFLFRMQQKLGNRRLFREGRAVLLYGRLPSVLRGAMPPLR